MERGAVPSASGEHPDALVPDPVVRDRGSPPPWMARLRVPQHRRLTPSHPLSLPLCLPLIPTVHQVHPEQEQPDDRDHDRSDDQGGTHAWLPWMGGGWCPRAASSSRTAASLTTSWTSTLPARVRRRPLHSMKRRRTPVIHRTRALASRYSATACPRRMHPLSSSALFGASERRTGVTNQSGERAGAERSQRSGVATLAERHANVSQPAGGRSA